MNRVRFVCSEIGDNKKYALLKDHYRPPSDFDFPLTTFGKQNRAALKACKTGRFEYLKKADSVWCVSCAFFDVIPKKDMRKDPTYFVN